MWPDMDSAREHGGVMSMAAPACCGAFTNVTQCGDVVGDVHTPPLWSTGTCDPNWNGCNTGIMDPLPFPAMLSGDQTGASRYIEVDVIIDVSDPTRAFLPTQCIQLHVPGHGAPVSVQVMGPAQHTETPGLNLDASGHTLGSVVPGRPYKPLSSFLNPSTVKPSLPINLETHLEPLDFLWKSGSGTDPTELEPFDSLTKEDSQLMNDTSIGSVSSLRRFSLSFTSSPKVGRPNDAWGNTSLMGALSMEPPMPPSMDLSVSSPRTMCKPLTAYNYFYRDERNHIVNHMVSPNDPLPPPVVDYSAEKLQALLHEHWHCDPFKLKRQHRRVHGKIEFHKLTNVISSRWRNLPRAGREFYHSVAKADLDEYTRFQKDIGMSLVDPLPWDLLP